MLHYLYLDYGGRAAVRRELRYSLISLRQELGDDPQARIAVYTDVPATYADIEDLASAVGFRPRTSIEDGIARFVAWYRDYYRA